MKSAISLMHGRAAAVATRTRASLQRGRLVEEFYERKISDLEGESFQPLAGINVTFGKVQATTASQEEAINEVLSLEYVEYTTGFRLTIKAAVTFDPGYFPIGIEAKAFNDALTLKLEEILNTCGYTQESDVPGLRTVASLSTGNVRLSELIDLDSYLYRFYYDAEQPVRQAPPSTEFEETDEHLIFRLRSPGIRLNYSGQCNLVKEFYASLRGTASLLDQEVTYLLPPHQLGYLNTLKGKRVWAPNPECRGAYVPLKVTDLSIDILPGIISGDFDRCYAYKPYSEALDIEPAPSSIDLPLSKRIFKVEWKEGYLVLTYPKDWIGATAHPLSIPLNPADWVQVRSRLVESKLECVDHRAKLYSAGLKAMTNGIEFNKETLDELGRRLERQQVLSTTVSLVGLPAKDAPVEADEDQARDDFWTSALQFLGRLDFTPKRRKR